jgi:hypothetical protein
VGFEPWLLRPSQRKHLLALDEALALRANRASAADTQLAAGRRSRDLREKRGHSLGSSS